jgi:hypothetical protein
MSGEAMHQKGADGTRRAKRWLDSTTRTKATWTNEDAVSAGRLEFHWPHDGQQPFSFDLGGILYGSPFDGHAFLAEVKKYSGSSDLGGHFDDFLAKCYLVHRDHSKWANEFMFLTWHPFRSNSWTKLGNKDSVVAGCVKNRSRLFDIPNGDSKEEKAQSVEQAKAAVDMDVVDELTARLWVVVLSKKQEELLMSDEDRALVIQSRIVKGLL